MISIIVPIYNVEKYLNQCIESICAQTYPDLEIILVDDGSTDRCAAICDDYAERDPRIVVIHKENGGLVSARKAGLLRATGEYIGYVDGDDWIEPDMYRLMHDALTEQKVDVVMCGRYEDTGSFSKPVHYGVPAGRYDRQAMRERIYPQMIVQGEFFRWGLFPGVWDKLYRRECLLPYQMEVDERIVVGEDAACVYPLLLNVDSIFILHQCLYHYRQSTGSMIKQIQDSEVERNRLLTLYRTVRDSLDRSVAIYDLRKQWEQYMLFLMIPRAENLYRGFGELHYLFPFPRVGRGSRIVLYGAGTYGQRLYQYLKKSGYCEVLLWADRNYAELSKMGLEVSAPEEIAATDFEQIVVAILYAEPRRAVYRELAERYGADKVSVIGEELILSEETKRALGLSASGE